MERKLQNLTPRKYRGRWVYHRAIENVWAFRIRNEENKLEWRVRNTFRAAKALIDENLAEKHK